jgi:hypothetical protein
MKISDGILNGKYKYLTNLDVSNNRLSGPVAGMAISKLLVNDNVINKESINTPL